MEFLTALWIPILVSGVVLFFASFVFWTKLPHHEQDWKKAPDEAALMDAIRQLNFPAGNYIFPWMSHQEMNDPEKQELYKQGPRGKLTLWDMPNMARNLVLTFLYFLAIALVAAYVGWAAIGGPVEGFMKPFQVMGAMGVLIFASSGQLNAIWFPRRTIMDFVDGIAYGLIMGLVFALFWPGSLW